MKRRQFLNRTGTLLAASWAFPAVVRADLKAAQVLVVGGGYGGATAAKYLRLLSDYRANVTLIEPELSFVSCPLSNLVLGGSSTLSELTVSYETLQKQHGVTLVRDWVTGIDPLKKVVQLKSGQTLGYDKLVLAPGIGLMMDSIEGLVQANQVGATLQAWKAGPETLALQQQLQQMPDGGVFALSIPEAPFRCPPGPYERACQVAAYFTKYKPKSKVLILDANQDVVSKPGLFKRAWTDLYPGMIEYRSSHNLLRVEAATKTLRFDIQDSVQADVLNVLPRMRAAEIVVQAGLANSNQRWAQVDFLNFEATAAKDIHVLGDSTQHAAFMPKSGHMANQHAKVAAAAIVAELRWFAINPQPVLTNTCYSFVSATTVVHVASVHQYHAADKTYKTVAGSGGVSLAPSELEATYAWGWARNIWADSLL
jgi:NADPH-dependent 2,4-dienoyl-CoA reductase/sulfur reductase-like enzyme